MNVSLGLIHVDKNSKLSSILLLYIIYLICALQVVVKWSVMEYVSVLFGSEHAGFHEAVSF
jgi:hypothetical protein